MIPNKLIYPFETRNKIFDFQAGFCEKQAAIEQAALPSQYISMVIII